MALTAARGVDGGEGNVNVSVRCQMIRTPFEGKKRERERERERESGILR